MQFSYTIASPPQNKPDYSLIGPAFMNAILFWNHAETTMRQIVQLLLGESAVSLAVAAEMGNRSLSQAVNTASKLPEMANLAEHLKHFSTGFERLLAYRNFYVHGIYATELDKGETIIRLLTIDGKNSIRMFNPTLSKSDFDAYTANVHKLIGYGVVIQRELGASGSGLDAMIATYQASLEMPEWLPALERVPQYLLAQVPQPPAFEA